jgi:hypothetical protein
MIFSDLYEAFQSRGEMRKIVPFRCFSVKRYYTNDTIRKIILDRDLRSEKPESSGSGE